MVCSTPGLLARKMDYINKVLCRNSYPDWFLKNLTTALVWTMSPTWKPLRNTLSQSGFIQGLSEEFRRIFKDTYPINLQRMQYS